MCGIFAYFHKINNKINNKLLKKLIINGKMCSHRGPDNTVYSVIRGTPDKFLLFNRLSINDITNMGNQPMKLDKCQLL